MESLQGSEAKKMKRAHELSERVLLEQGNELRLLKEKGGNVEEMRGRTKRLISCSHFVRSNTFLDDL